MTKADQLELLMLLSALESWGFANNCTLPPYLHDRLDNAVNRLTGEILEPTNKHLNTIGEWTICAK
jgi:hypothetical protein